MNSFTSLKFLQRLNPASRGACTDGHERLRHAADLTDSLGVVRRRNRALDERQIVRAANPCARRLQKLRDLDRARHGEQFVFAVQETQLAAVAGSELPDRERGLALH